MNCILGRRYCETERKGEGWRGGRRNRAAPRPPKLRTLTAWPCSCSEWEKAQVLQVNNLLFPSMDFDSRGSLGTGGSTSAWRSHCSFASQRKKKWHLSQVRQSVVGFASPILSSLFLLPSPSPPPLPVGREKVGGGGGPTGHRRRGGILFLWLLPANGGQDAIGSASCASGCLSLSNSEQQRRQEATPPGPGSVRCFKRETEGEKKEQSSLTYCTLKNEASSGW